MGLFILTRQGEAELNIKDRCADLETIMSDVE